MIFRVAFLHLISAFALVSAMPADASAQDRTDSFSKIAVAEIPTGSSDANLQATVRRTVRSMMDYTTWPNNRETRTLCIIGPSRFGGNLDRMKLVSASLVLKSQKPANTADFANCDAVYLGQIDMASMRAATKAVRGKAVLTIAEDDRECRSRAMFCLVFSDNAMTFRLNVDSISRSKVRVDPRVLRLAKEG